jgi:YfiH family protein
MALVLIRPAEPLGAGIHALTTTRDGGVSRAPFDTLNLGDHVGDAPTAVDENRRRLGMATGCQRIQWLQQVHGTRCVRASLATAGQVPEADAAWTDVAGLGLAVLTADCVPVVVCAPAAGIVGIAHAGWRGLVGGVLEALIGALPVGAGELVGWLGPAIGPAHYQVDGSLVEAVAALPDGAALVGRVVGSDPAPGRYRLDLFQLATELLARAGVARVTCDRISTFADGRCYSHRRATAAGSTTGRMATVVWRGAGSA